MHGGERLARGLVVGLVLVSVSGCATLGDYRRVQAANRSLKAEKESLAQELFDSRSVGDSLRTQVNSLDQQVSAKDELVSNLRSENELLDEMRRTAQASLEDMAKNQTLGNITLAGPALPPPLDNALNRFSQGHSGLVTYDATRGIVKWKSDLLFALGSDIVKESSRRSLADFAEVVKSAAAEEFEVLVVGHTDNRPVVRAETKAKHPTNWHLSAHRAIAVSFELARAGYAPTRIGVMGYGEHRPIADNAAQGGASQNRRVEIYLVRRGAIVQASTVYISPNGEKVAAASVQP